MIREMGNKELLENMAFDMLQDKEYRDRVLQNISLEEQEGQSAAEESRRMIEMFKTMGLRSR